MLWRVTVNNCVIARHLAGRVNPEDCSIILSGIQAISQSIAGIAAVVPLFRNGVLIYRRRVHGFPVERIYGTTSRNAGFFPAFRLVVLRLRT